MELKQLKLFVHYKFLFLLIFEIGSLIYVKPYLFFYHMFCNCIFYIFMVRFLQIHDKAVAIQLWKTNKHFILLPINQDALISYKSTIRDTAKHCLFVFVITLFLLNRTQLILFKIMINKLTFASQTNCGYTVFQDLHTHTITLSFNRILVLLKFIECSVLLQTSLLVESRGSHSCTIIYWLHTHGVSEQLLPTFTQFR